MTQNRVYGVNQKSHHHHREKLLMSNFLQILVIQNFTVHFLERTKRVDRRKLSFNFQILVIKN